MLIPKKNGPQSNVHKMLVPKNVGEKEFVEKNFHKYVTVKKEFF